MRNRDGLLTRLLQALVEEWGYEQVVQELSRTNRNLPELSIRRAISPSAHSPKRKVKLKPTEQVERTPLEPSRKDALLQLAKRYEEKQFLPNVAAVKEFLIMTGHDPGSIKDRDHAFRTLLRTLLQLPIERLNQLSHSSLHSGPSQLGPISDAIAAASEHLPRRSQEAGARERTDRDEKKP